MRPRLAPSLTRAELIQLCQTGRVDVPPAAQATGYTELDQALPGGGLPVGAVTEILSTEGAGELGLVVRALAQITQNDRYIAWVRPPHLPYPPALVQQGVRLERIIEVRSSLEQTLWAGEQLLRCPAFGAVLLWPAMPADKDIRRLQLAAEAGGNLAIVYRPVRAMQMSSPAALRLLLHPGSPLRIEIKKCRGGRADRSVYCATDTQLKSA